MFIMLIGFLFVVDSCFKLNNIERRGCWIKQKSEKTAVYVRQYIFTCHRQKVIYYLKILENIHFFVNIRLTIIM